MNFVDRTDETARLKEALSGERSALVVIYGRRRLGKSTVIKRALTEDDVYFLADRSEGQHQRSMLAKVVGQLFPDFDKLTYPDWEALLRAVNYRTINHFTLCLDEFPYLVEQSPELPSVLQKLIDEKTLKYNISKYDVWSIPGLYGSSLRTSRCYYEIYAHPITIYPGSIGL